MGNKNAKGREREKDRKRREREKDREKDRKRAAHYRAMMLGQVVIPSLVYILTLHVYHHCGLLEFTCGNLLKVDPPEEFLEVKEEDIPEVNRVVSKVRCIVCVCVCVCFV